VRYRFGSTLDRPPLSEFHRQPAGDVKYDSKKAANVLMVVEDRCLVFALVEPRAKIGPIHRDFSRMHIPETNPHAGVGALLSGLSRRRNISSSIGIKGLMHDNPWTYCDQSVPSFARRSCG
jgi:hypothetical protein